MPATQDNIISIFLTLFSMCGYDFDMRFKDIIE